MGGGCALLACVGLIVALAITFLQPRATQSNAAPSPIANAVEVSPQVTNATSSGPGNTMGKANAPVKLIEYADFQCPYCRRFWQETEPQIIQIYVSTGKVYYEYRSVGGFLGPESADAAKAAYCAGDQGKFWQYHNELYANWTGENVGDFAKAKLSQYATTVGLDVATFESCLSSGKYAARVQQDVLDAKAAGVQATPSFLINGKLVEGAQPFAVFQKEIDAALNGP